MSHIRSPAFMVRFSFLLVGTLAVLLLMKKADDRLLSKSEAHEREHLQATEASGHPRTILPARNAAAPAREPDPSQRFRRYDRGPGAREFTGTDLGLYPIRNLDRLQHGDVDYRADADGWVEFNLQLPARPPRAA
jgi:hypothetical protein